MIKDTCESARRRIRLPPIIGKGPLEMSRVEEMAWLAGIIEGEGSVRYKDGSFELKVQMTDSDTINKVAIILRKWTDKAIHIRYIERKPPQQPTFEACVCGKYEVWHVANKIYRFLSERRQGQIDAMIDERKQSNDITLKELDLA